MVESIADLEEIIASMPVEFKIVRNRAARQEQLFYDTFDWRLFTQGWMLFRKGKTLTLQNYREDRPVHRLNWEGSDPTFWWSFQDSRMIEILKPHLDIRSLLPLLTLHSRTQTIRFLNDDEKTIFRLICFQAEGITGKEEPSNMLWIQSDPVRGYPGPARSIQQLLVKKGGRLDSREPYRIILELAGFKPGLYTSKVKVRLDPAASTQKAMIHVFLHLLEKIRANENGIIEDVDTEFLHDFRVSIRRTRSAMNQVHGGFSDEENHRWNRIFREFCKITNRLRDLDVFLLHEESYRNILPLEFIPSLRPIFKTIVKKRCTEQKKVAEFLLSDTYRRRIEAWQKFLTEKTEILNSTPDRKAGSIIRTAKKTIIKRYRVIVRNGEAIDDDSPDQDLHRLRIDCKKLRYLLEFFQSLFPASEIKRLIDQLKRLQDNLGLFNDLSVQQDELRGMLKALNRQDAGVKKKAGAIAGLITHLFGLQRDVRSDFEATFKCFASSFYRSSYQRLFSNNPSVGGED